MAYVIDWSNPEMPRPRDAPDGDSAETVIDLLLRHHLEVIKAHCRAIERLLDDVLR